MELSIQQIAEAIGALVEGDARTMIRGVASVDAAEAGHITFAVDARRAAQLAVPSASAVLVKPDVPVPAGMAALRTADPKAALAAVLGLFAPPEDLPAPGVHPTATISPEARLGRDVAIGPHVVVGAGAAIGDGAALCANVCVGASAVIGDGTVLFPGVVVRERCVIGKRCRLHANAVIGADGFGYYFRDGVHRKVPHVGIVQIGDDVEIGACTCVDRAKWSATRIGDGAKIDNLVQIGHNAVIGRGAIIVGCVAIAGSAVLGDFAVIGGHGGVRENVTVGAGARVGAYSVALQDVPAGQEVAGIPAVPAAEWLRFAKSWPKLPELRRQVRELQARLDALERTTKDDRPQR